ncbi:MAG TPA: hypothetical protein VKX49_17525 [Bryobacteraceae bacterium]|nr:hypothetical protein [Bryobacteraceae bacterium]
MAAKDAAEMESAETARQVLSQAAIDPVELTSLECYRLHLRRRVHEIGNLERQCEAKIIDQRQRVIEARRQLELLDRLHAQAWKEWTVAANKEQEDLAAEMFLARGTRNRGLRRGNRGAEMADDGR